MQGSASLVITIQSAVTAGLGYLYVYAMIKGHMVENHVMVDKETIEQFFDSLQDLAHLEKTVAEKTEYLRKADYKLEFEIHDILEAREEMENGPHGFYRWVSQHATSSAYGMFTEQQKTVFCEMMGMGYVKGVAEKLGPPYRWYLYKGS